MEETVQFGTLPDIDALSLPDPWVPSWWERLGDVVRNVVYPARCVSCGRWQDRNRSPFCAQCLETLSDGGRACCLRCGMPLPAEYRQHQHGCSWCADSSYPFDACTAAVAYTEPIRGLILRFKRAEAGYLAHALAWLLCYQRGALLTRWDIEVIVPVPRHWMRRLRMGHNHVELLAVELKRLLGQPAQVAPRSVCRRRATRVHRGMGPKQRASNVAGAFAVRCEESIRGRRVLLVDDVMTSGATLCELARTVRRARPAGLYVAVVARARSAR